MTCDIRRRAEQTESLYATFLDLVDLLFVNRFLKQGYSLQKVRRALDEADRVIGGHHFAQRCFFTDGKEIYLRVREKETDNLLQLLSGGQWVISEVILKFATQVDFDGNTGFAERWYPKGKDGRVVLDPRIAFGAPTILGRGVRTANVYDLYQAEKERTRAVAEWMELDESDVEAAVEFEASMAA